MNNLHIHEVLRMISETQKTYDKKDDFVTDIIEIFGADARFFACSAENMDANEAYEFLIKKGKLSANADTKIGIAPDMTMCDDENHPHNHHHNHDH